MDIWSILQVSSKTSFVTIVNSKLQESMILITTVAKRNDNMSDKQVSSAQQTLVDRSFEYNSQIQSAHQKVELKNRSMQKTHITLLGNFHPYYPSLRTQHEL